VEDGPYQPPHPIQDGGGEIGFVFRIAMIEDQVTEHRFAAFPQGQMNRTRRRLRFCDGSPQAVPPHTDFRPKG
jgi:hypothetical protein